MIDSSLLHDLLAYSAQIACIAVIGAALIALLRIDVPGVRYGFFRVLLGVCLLLPLAQGRQPAPRDAGTVALTSSVVAFATSDAEASQRGVNWTALVSTLLVGGVVVRALWIALGLARLRRLRQAGDVVTHHDGHDELQSLLGTRAEIRSVAGLQQPVTFGVWRPVVLLPEALLTHVAHVQRAVLSHELIHVQRRDWLWLILEEAVRAVFWFHPGVWWIVSHIQLAREEVVDDLAMLATGTRRGYLEALATFADETPLMPAAGFARRRHLLRRMRLIAKGATMSSRRIAWSCAVMALVVAAGSWYAVEAFPLREPAAQEPRNDAGPLEKRARTITPENPVPRRSYSVDPIYPAEAAAVDANAIVTLLITLDEGGRVGEIRRLGVSPAATSTTFPDDQQMRAGFDALVRAAGEAVRQWQYDPPAEGPLSIRVTFAFAPAIAPRLVSHDGWSVDTSPSTRTARDGQTRFIPPPPPPPPPPRAETTLTVPSSTGALRVGGNIRPPTKVKHVNPVYPDSARNAKVQGVVILEALIGSDGKVGNARVLRSIPMLDQAAVDAVMQWEFTPTVMSGQAMPVLMTVTVQFTTEF